MHTRTHTKTAQHVQKKSCNSFTSVNVFFSTQQNRHILEIILTKGIYESTADNWYNIHAHADVFNCIVKITQIERNKMNNCYRTNYYPYLTA